MLGITHRDDDGYGHLGYPSVPDLSPFGSDVFTSRDNKCAGDWSFRWPRDSRGV